MVSRNVLLSASSWMLYQLMRIWRQRRPSLRASVLNYTFTVVKVRRNAVLASPINSMQRSGAPKRQYPQRSGHSAAQKCNFKYWHKTDSVKCLHGFYFNLVSQFPVIGALLVPAVRWMCNWDFVCICCMCYWKMLTVSLPMPLTF